MASQGYKDLAQGAISFTSKAQNLVSLELWLTSDWCRFGDLTKGLMLPKLKKLALCEMRFHWRGALEFCKRHSPTLESLSLSATILVTDPGELSLFDFFQEVQSELSLKSLELHSLLQQGPEFGDDWPVRYPETIPPERATRYLVCGQKTNMVGELDAISRHPYEWGKITWSSIEADFERLSCSIPRNAPIPDSWRKNPYAPQRWIPNGAWGGDGDGDVDSSSKDNDDDD